MDHEVKPMVNEAGLGDLTTEELAQRMWNCDETAFATDVASKRVLARRREKVFMKQVVDQAENI